MLSYHNDPALKLKFQEHFAAHRAADEVTQGTGFDNGRTRHGGRHPSRKLNMETCNTERVLLALLCPLGGLAALLFATILVLEFSC